MSEVYIQDKTLNNEDSIITGEYDHCTFNSFDFSDKDLSNFKFINCTFKDCNLSLATLNNTLFQDAAFINCKMLGLRFDNCNKFGLSFSFEGCQLNHSSFYKLKIKNTIFSNSQLRETDFVETDLTSATFNNCDLLQANFDQTILEKSDFRNSFNYSINPEINKIKKAKFSISGIPGLLDQHDIIIEN